MGELRQRQPRLVDEKYLERIRELPCCVCGASGPSDAAHLRMAGAGWGVWGEGKESTGMAEKPNDNYAVPLCKPRHKPDHVARKLNPDKPLKMIAVGCHGLQHGHSIKKIRELTDDTECWSLEEAFWRSTGKNPFMIAAGLYEKFGTTLRVRRKPQHHPRRKEGTPKRKIENRKSKIPSRGFPKGKRKVPSRKQRK